MHTALTTLGLGVAIFAATNVDDLLLLVGLFSDVTFRPAEIVWGQLVGIALLFAASVAGSFVSLVIPAAGIGLLGLAPILIGMLKLVAPSSRDASDAATRQGRAAPLWKTLAVAGLTLANGGDNVATYVPVFATLTGPQLALIAVIFVGLILSWCRAAFWLARHPAMGHLSRRYGTIVLPYALIGLGLFILYRSDTIALWRSH